MIKEQKKRTWSEEVVKTQHFCDKCEKEYEHDSGYDISNCSFEMNIGGNYPSGGSQETWRIDFCSDCGEEMLDMLKEMNIRVNYKEIDW